MILEIAEILTLIKEHNSSAYQQLIKNQASAKASDRLIIIVAQSTAASMDHIASTLGYDAASSPAFRSLCYRVRDQLLQRLSNIYVLDNSSTVKKNISRLYQRLTLIFLLFTEARRVSAVRLTRSFIRDCLKYDQYRLANTAIHYLLRHYSYSETNLKQWAYYADLQKKVSDEILALDRAEVYYTEISYLALHKSKSHGEQLDQLLQEAVDEFEQHGLRYDNFDYWSKRSQLEQYYLNRKGLHELCIERADATYALLRDRPLFNVSTVAALTTAKIDALLNLHRYTEVAEQLEHLDIYMVTDTHNWYKHQRKKLLVHSLTKDYQAMHDLTVTMLDSKDIKTKPTYFQIWKIREAYIAFLVKMGKVPLADPRFAQNFRVGRFLNEVPELTKDKEGLNTAILIAQVLHLIQRNRLDKIQDRLDSLTKYCHRYLHRDATYRSNCMIKMLLQLPNSAYQPQRARRYVSKYLDKLKDYPREITVENFNPEVIDYRDLWEMIVDILPQKGYRPRKPSDVAP